jgi:hypothetical protein
MVHALRPEKLTQLLLSGHWVFKVRSISRERLVDEAGEYALQMDILPGQSPGMVRKQLWGRSWCMTSCAG